MTKYKDPIARQVHREAKLLLKFGLIDASAMRDFDEECLEPVKNPFAAFFHRPPAPITAHA
jgi:DNA-binding transcriptional regulator YiaG